MSEPLKKGKTNEKDRSKIFFPLFIDNQKRIYTYILMLVPNRTYADEIMQEVSVILWQKFDTFTLGSNFVAWGIKIARLEVLSFYKKQRAKRVIFDSDLMNMLSIQAEPTLNTMDAQIDALRKCVRKLKDTDRELIHLHYEKNYTIKDISGHVNRSVHALYKVFNRIHHYLLKCIQRTMRAEEAI